MAREEGFFDELARGLADGSVTRGRALRLMGAALVGGTLGSLGIGEAAADPPGCKREGKNCTRNNQCCSGLICDGLSRTCQAPPTTTVPPTTTAAPTTTTAPTTTAPPTTTTTPMCIPNGSGCSTGGTPCCNGNCNSNGFCCPDGRVGVSNGTCALPCPSVGECPGFPFCSCLNSTEGGFCAGSQSGKFCDPDLPGFCPSGELCSVGVCFTAC
jgi:hypothetical protein